MIFRTKDPYEWNRSFAFTPEQIGFEGGRKVYVWLQYYEWRYTPGGLTYDIRLSSDHPSQVLYNNGPE